MKRYISTETMITQRVAVLAESINENQKRMLRCLSKHKMSQLTPLNLAKASEVLLHA